MVKTPHFHCRLHGFDPWLGCEDPICHGAQPKFLNICVLSRFSRVPLFVTPWTVACQPSLSIGFPRQEYWSGLLCPLPADLPKPGIEPTSLNVSCIGRRVLYHEHHLGSSLSVSSSQRPCLIYQCRSRHSVESSLSTRPVSEHI